MSKGKVDRFGHRAVHSPLGLRGGTFILTGALLLGWSGIALGADEPTDRAPRRPAARIVCMVGLEDGWMVAEGRTIDQVRRLVWRVRLARVGPDSLMSVRYDGPAVVVTSGRQRFVIDARTGQIRFVKREGPEERRGDRDRPEGRERRREDRDRPEGREAPRKDRDRPEGREQRERREGFAEAEAQLHNLNQHIEHAEVEFKRLRALREKGQATEKQVDEAEKRLKTILQKRDAFRRQLERRREGARRPLGAERRERLAVAEARARELARQLEKAEVELNRVRRWREKGEATAEQVATAEKMRMKVQVKFEAARRELEKLRRTGAGAADAERRERIAKTEDKLREQAALLEKSEADLRQLRQLHQKGQATEKQIAQIERAESDLMELRNRLDAARRELEELRRAKPPRREK